LLFSKAQQMLAPTKELLDLDQLSNLEETAYNEGFSAGQSHGKLHGLFEGRELGTLKGFEVWEEIGYIQGMATFWLRTLPAETITSTTSSTTKTRKQSKQIQQVESLLDMITTLPMENREDVNLFGIMEKIRAKYKLLCFTLAISPAEVAPVQDQGAASGDNSEPGRMVKIHGRSVDTSKLNF
jgi:hypothetical protein